MEGILHMTACCPICATEGAETVFKPGFRLPLARYGLGLDLSSAKDCTRYEIDIHRCARCDHYFNAAFVGQTVDYTSDNIAESRTFSPRYKDFLTGQVDEIMKSVGDDLDCVLEVGSGQGDFLAMFPDSARRIGFEPGPEGDVSIGLYPDVEVRRTYFVADDVLKEDLAPDLIIMRQVLEHVPDPMVFLKAYHALLSRTEGGNGLLYVEVPSTNATIEKGRFSDFYYDHVGFFTLNSMSEALRSVGFFIERLELAFDGEIISCFARPAETVLRQSRFSDRQAYWQDLFSGLEGSGKKVVFWGSAGTGTMFLNMVGIDRDEFPFVVDSDPRKVGKFIPGTGQEVVPPEFIADYRPDVVVILSQLHSKEIAGTVSEILDYEPTVYTL